MTEGAKPVKPGHVTEFIWGARSNLRNVRGELQLSVVDRSSGVPLLIEGTRFQLSHNRTVILPKGQDKQFRLIYPLPRLVTDSQSKFALRHRLIPRQAGRALNLTRDFVTPIPGYQYFLLVLADQSDRYSFVKQLYSIRQPPFDLATVDPEVYYQVVVAEPDRPVPVPEHELAWSSIAHIVWDELEPQRLSERQQQALIAWLHWGGQLFISGPGSLDRLKGSFLAPYLPATSGGNRRLTQADFDEFNASWKFRTDGKHGKPEVEVIEDRPLGGIKLVPHREATFVAGTGQLVVERRIGRGRIAVTAFPLDARPLINWIGYDSFFNSCVLRRPRREFRLLENVQPVWSYLVTEDEGESPIIPVTALTTACRFFARDTSPSPRLDIQDSFDYWQIDGSVPHGSAGIAGWNDQSLVAEAATRAVSDASGITVPGRGFVWKSLALYLLVLVPVNWGVFRLFGRVEWAWVATPLIAVVGAVWIVREAQLDIGFVRSRTEVTVLELHRGYSRGHLSRFVGLYSSLSTSFDVQFESPAAIVQPFGGGNRETIQGTRSVSLWNDRHTRLTDFFVISNSTGIFHSEEYADVGGSIEYQPQGSSPTLVNHSQLDLQGVGVIRRGRDGGIELAWAGRLEPNGRASLTFQPASPVSPWLSQWDDHPVTSSKRGASSRLPSVNELIKVALRNLTLRSGEARMVGWIEESLPGLEITPGISQTHGVTFVIQHLKFAELEPPRRDSNLIEHVQHEDANPPDNSSILNRFK